MYLVSIGGAVDLLGLAGDVQGEGELGRVRGGVARSNHAAHHLFKDNTTPQYTTMQQQNKTATATAVGRQRQWYIPGYSSLYVCTYVEAFNYYARAERRPWHWGHRVP